MQLYEGIIYQQYRKTSYFDGNEIKYFIEKKKGDKWIFCFGGIDYKEANRFLSNTSLIESEMKKFRITSYFVVSFILICILYLIFNN